MPLLQRLLRDRRIQPAPAAAVSASAAFATGATQPVDSPAMEAPASADRLQRGPFGGWPEQAIGTLRDRSLALVVLGVVALAIGVRVPGALSLPLWQDEVASARVIVEPTLGDVISHVRATESTPPAWYVLAWLGHRAGISLEGLRLASVVLSAVTAGWLVVYARRFVPLLAAGTAGVLAAVGWQFVAHGRELRAYALYALLSLAFAVLLERAARRPTAGRLAALGCCVALGGLTHYFFVLAVAVGALWLWLTPIGARARLRSAAAMGAGLIPLLAWLPVLADQYSAHRFDWIGDFNGLKASYFYGTLFDAGGTLYSFVPAPFGSRQWWWLAVLTLVLAGSVVLWRRGRSRRAVPGDGVIWPAAQARLCGLLAVGPVAITLLVWLSGPDVFNTRNLFVAAPFAAVAAAAPLALLRRPLALAGAGALIALAVIATVQADPLGPPADRIAQALVAQGWTPQSRVVLFADDFYGFRSPIGWYLPGRPFLQLTSPIAGDAPAFVVVKGTAGWDVLDLGGDVGPVERIDNVYVARLHGGDALLSSLAARRGAVLAAPSG